jgi:hypothetical protein
MPSNASALNLFSRGDLCGVLFQPVGASIAQAVNITGWNRKRSVLLFDCTHTGLFGVGTGRIVGKADSSGTVNADYDMSAPPYAPVPSIIEGVSGIILDFVSPTKAIQSPITIEELNWESNTTTQVKWNFTWKENVFVGLPVYPSFP